uniref:HDC14231 n=1 Tax=Drosophila melanogaster TaxID=7227 RepID=Q6IJU0_DROME|nr:TPA_inf: HDC14231 [Drosophila melanogaster]
MLVVISSSTVALAQHEGLKSEHFLEKLQPARCSWIPQIPRSAAVPLLVALNILLLIKYITRRNTKGQPGCEPRSLIAFRPKCVNEIIHHKLRRPFQIFSRCKPPRTSAPGNVAQPASQPASQQAIQQTTCALSDRQKRLTIENKTIRIRFLTGNIAEIADRTRLIDPTIDRSTRIKFGAGGVSERPTSLVASE